MNPFLAFLKALPELVSVLKELVGAVKSIPAIKAHNENEATKAKRNEIMVNLEKENDIEKRRDLLRRLADLE